MSNGVVLIKLGVIRWTESLHFLEALLSSVKCWVPCLTESILNWKEPTTVTKQLVHSLNTIYQIIYFNTVWVGWGPHTQFIPWWPFCHVKIIMSQNNSNYWTTCVILIVSKIFTWLNYTFHSIYSNTSPSTKHNLPNNLFQHTLVV